MKKFLLVEGDFVYPPNHGGRVDAWNRILTISRMDTYIHLICTVKEFPPQKYIDVVKQNVDELTIILRNNRLMYAFCKRPWQMISRSGLKNVVFDCVYDYLIMGNSYVFDIVDNPSLKVKHKILRMQNDEMIYFRGLGRATINPLKKVYYYLESVKFYFYDKKIIEKVPNVMFISYDEMKRYKHKYNNINEIFLPTAVNCDFRKRKLDNNNVLIIGSLFMVNNQEGIRYYVNKVHPLLSDITDYRLIIAGNSRGQSIAWLKKLTSQFNNIEVYDSPDDLEPFYANSSVFVNPMINGAGVKLKTVNAVIQGLPVVTTTTGNEGTGFKHMRDIIVADEAEQIAENIKSLFRNRIKSKRIVVNGQRYLKENYDQKGILFNYLANM